MQVTWWMMNKKLFNRTRPMDVIFFSNELLII
jgi:hypothetical protein